MGKDLKGKELGEGICQRENGRYLARYRSRSGKRPEKSFDKLNEAKKWLTEQKYQEEHGNYTIANNMTVDEWFECWMENVKKPTVRESTCRAYTSRYRNMISPVIGDIALADVKPIHCQNVINKAQETEASGSVETLKRVMKQMFETAEENRLIYQTPITRNVKVKRKPVGERRVMTETEQNKFSDYILEHGTAGGDLFLFVLETGLRTSEAVGLKWENVDGNCIRIDHQTYPSAGKGFIDVPPKSRAGTRTIPLTQNAAHILQNLKREKVENIKNHAYVFKTKNGTLRTRAALDATLATVCKNIGIEHISMHTLRHSFATRCIERGMRPKTLQKILGHSNLNITMDLYVHVTDECLEAEMAKFERGRQVGGLQKVKTWETA